MHNTQAIIEQVRGLAAQVDVADRLAMIRAIVTVGAEVDAPELPTDDISHPLEAEQSAWFARSTAARRRYGEDFVTVYHGEVIDQDPDQRNLYLRVRAQYGRIPVLIVPARWDAPPTYTFHLLAHRPRRLPTQA